MAEPPQALLIEEQKERIAELEAKLAEAEECARESAEIMRRARERTDCDLIDLIIERLNEAGLRTAATIVSNMRV